MSARVMEIMQGEFLDSCRELFDEYGIDLRSSDHEVEFTGMESVAVIGATGVDIRASVTVQLPRAVTNATCPAEMQLMSNADHEDWIGELTNQLMGRFKNKILPYNCELNIDIPNVIHGKKLRPMLPKRSQIISLNFDCKHGEIGCRLALLLETGFENHFSEIPLHQVDVMDEGELLFF